MGLGLGDEPHTDEHRTARQRSEQRHEHSVDCGVVRDDAHSGPTRRAFSLMEPVSS